MGLFFFLIILMVAGDEFHKHSISSITILAYTRRTTQAVIAQKDDGINTCTGFCVIYSSIIKIALNSRACRVVQTCEYTDTPKTLFLGHIRNYV